MAKYKIVSDTTNTTPTPTRQEYIHSKGFDFDDISDLRVTDENYIEYKRKIKAGLKVLEDAVINVSAYNRMLPPQYRGKSNILETIATKNYEAMREISEYFYNMNGIYRRVCNYLARLYRYDWYVTPEILDEKVKDEKVVSDFMKTLRFLDNSYLKRLCGDIALKVIKFGVYYGYIFESSERIIM